MHEILHAFIHSLKDTAIVFPLLFITYLVIEAIEHKAGEKTTNFIAKSGKTGPLFGALLGLIPQCGFSSAAATLYSVGTITAGTLVAVFLATSDEMLPILISNAVPPKEIILILGIKLICGVIFGFTIDMIYKRKKELCIDHMCEQENCDCEHHGIFKSALKHSVKIISIIFAVTLLINIVIEFIGKDNLGSLFITKPVIGELISGLIGLIPNCSASVLLTDLYVNNALSMGQMLSGLCVNAGIGLIVLFRTNKNIKENIFLTVTLYVIGVLTGIIVSAIL